MPALKGPDVISISFNVDPDAVKSARELESEVIQDDFDAVIGNLFAEVDEETGMAVISGEDTAKDELTREERQKLEDRRNSMLDRIKADLDDDWEDDDDLPDSDQVRDR